MESSRISTAQRNDLWTEIETTVKLLVGEKEGRSVVVSPQTGNIVLRALPREIRSVSDYLEATRISVQRQVMLEAKVVEVQLSDSERTGINWAAFRLGLSTRASGGALAPGASLAPTGTIGDGLLTVNPGVAIDAAATAAGSLLGLAFQTRNFAAVLDFLGTQGNTQVLSSPRIATMNNQKAVLKVGTDDFFVTSISSTTTAVGNTTATTPNIGVQPFFSGISLDVTPNIDASGYITLHVHPSVSTVSERTKVINLGTQGSYSLPLASSQINESDAVVRAHDGNIIAIGGLMRQASVNSDSGIPGSEGTVWRKLLGGQTNRLSEKRELVILLKPTIVDPSLEDSDLRRDALQRLLDWMENQPPLKQATSARAARATVPATPPPPLAQAAVPAPTPAPPEARPVAQAGVPPAAEPVALDWAAMGQARPSVPVGNRPGLSKSVTPPPSAGAGAGPPDRAAVLANAGVVAEVRASTVAPAGSRSGPHPAPVLAVQLSDRLPAERPIRRPAARLGTVPTPGILMPKRVVPMTNPWQTASRATPLLPPEALPAVPARWLQLGKVARAVSQSANPA
jgi:MSHA type pilus biogenesis protein MshL